MTFDPRRLDGMDPKAKRELLARLLKERASGSGDTFELSLGQEALFFLNQLAPQAVPYNVALCGRVRAKIDFGRFESALLKLLERHPILRCTFGLSAERPMQRIGPVPARCLETIDASGWSEDELKTRVRESYGRPFDLANGPLFRASLFTRNDADHVLLITAHHIVFDATSLGIIVTDLATLYEKGSAASLPPQLASYADFVKWQRRMVGSGEGREAWNYWRSRLEGSLTPIDLPGDHTRPNIQSFQGGTYRFVLPAALCMQLRGLARAENATPYIVLAAAFHALLHRYTGTAAVPIGMPLAGRSRREFENIVGYFVNPVVLCARVESGTTFRQHVADMRETAIGAQRHGDFPFPELVKRLQPARDTSRTPLFQVMLNLIKGTQVGLGIDAPHPERNTLLHLGPLPVEEYPLEQQEGQFDLDLDVVDTGAAMPAFLKYSTDLFEADTIERMAGHFVTLLSAAIADPNRRIADLPLLTDAELAQVLVEWNATDRVYPETTIERLIEEQVRRAPDATALVFEGHTMSRGELNRRANQLARHLRGIAVGPDTLVGICMERSFEMVVGLLGILKAGGAYVPVDPGYPAERQAYMIQDSRAPVLLTQARLAGGLAKTGARVVVLDTGWEEIARESGEDLDGGAGPDNLAYVIYTSGSTGKPKGVQIPRGALGNLLWSMREWLRLSERDRLLAVTTISFDIAGVDVWLPLLVGAQTVMASRETAADSAGLRGLLERHDISFLQATPATWRVLFDAGWRGKPDLQAVCTGEAMPPEVAAQLAPVVQRAWNLYGPTETTIWSTGFEVRSGRKPILIGRPVANTQCYILDSQKQAVPIGVTGELYISGQGLARGYLNRPDLTAEKFVRNPFRGAGERMYRTGDLARYRADGNIECLGRVDHQVKIRGYRIELGEIEAALCEHASVGQAVVMPREDTPGDVRLVAYLVARPQASIETAALRAYLRERLPDYMVPSGFMAMPVLPLNPSGKVDRKALPAPDTMRPSLATLYEAPRTEVESAIAAVWKDVLRVEKVGIHDNFFDLGGHSLLLIKVQAQLEEYLKRKLAIVELFQYPNIEALSRHLTIQEDISPERERIQEQAERQKRAISDRKDRRATRP